MSRSAPNLTARKAFKGTTVEALRKELTAAISDLQRQLNAQGRVLPHVRNGVQPRGMSNGDRLMGRGTRGNITGIPDGKGNVITQEVPDSVTQFQDPQTGAGAPTTANFPVIGDFGWYRDTTNNVTYFVQNRSGAIDNISLSTFTGSISDLSGTITDAQHGARAGGTLHATATGSVAGFLSATDKSLINTATDAATGSALCQRDVNGDLTVRRMNSNRYNVAGTQVVSAQGTGYLNISVTSLKDGSAITTAFNATNFGLLVRFTATVFDYLGVSGHGLIDL